MQFGVCCPIEQADEAKRYGWDFVELNVQTAFQGTLADDAVKPLPKSVLPTPAANSLIPGAMKIVGPDVNIGAVAEYLARVTERAARIGCKTLVFGSGVARNAPDGWERAKTRQQIMDFLAAAGHIAAQRDITLVVEPLNRSETNVLNSLLDSVRIVRELSLPNVKQLVDTYHYWLEDDQIDDILQGRDLIQHVHVADKEGRVPPGESGTSDYRPVFRALKQIAYDARISVECAGWDWAKHGEHVLAFLKREWAAA